MTPKAGYHEPRLGSIKRAPLIPNDSPAITGNHGEIAATPRPIGGGGASFWPLIAAKDSSLLAHFRRSNIGVEMNPNM